MSFAEHPLRNRQSAHATYTVPPASISADTRPRPSRKFVGGDAAVIEAIELGPV